VNEPYTITVTGPEGELLMERTIDRPRLLGSGFEGVLRRIEYLELARARGLEECTCTRHRLCAPCLREGQ
jgi:hypothetical protein